MTENSSDEAQFDHPPAQKDKRGKEILSLEDLQRLRKQMFGNYIFLFGNLTCSLEHKFLKRCFEDNKTSNKDDCLKFTKSYGNCLYDRYQKPVERAVQTLCEKKYKKYKNCVWMSTFRSNSCDDKWNDFSRCVSDTLCIDKAHVRRK
eukprot:gene8930-879_t